MLSIGRMVRLLHHPLNFAILVSLINTIPSHSVVSQRTASIPWSSFIDSCASKLSQEGEFPTDQYLIGQVRLQHLLERVDPLIKRGFGEGQVMAQDVEAIIRSLKSEANECKAQLSLPASRDGKLALALCCRELGSLTLF